MSKTFQNHTSRYAFGGWSPLSEAGCSLCWAAGTPPTAEFPAGLARSDATRSGRGRASSEQQQPPWPGARCSQGTEGGGGGTAPPLRLLEAARDGVCSFSACLPPSLQATAARDGRNLSRGAAVPGQPGAGEHMAEVTMAAPYSLLAAPPFSPRLPGGARRRYRFACGPCHRWSARRTRPGAPPWWTSPRPGAAPHAQRRDGSAPKGGMAGAARGTLGTRPAARGGGGAGHATQGAGLLTEPAQSWGAAPPDLGPRLAGAAEQRGRETGRGQRSSSTGF